MGAVLHAHSHAVTPVTSCSHMLGAESRESARSSGRMCTSVVHGPGRFRGTRLSAERRLAPANVPTRARKRADSRP